MRKILLPFVLLIASWAEPQSNDYPVNVHVRSSYWNLEPSLIESHPVLRLQVVIEGKNAELAAPATLNANFQAGVTLLIPGDYKARLVRMCTKLPMNLPKPMNSFCPTRRRESSWWWG
jgi:hypothetical protein